MKIYLVPKKDGKERWLGGYVDAKKAETAVGLDPNSIGKIISIEVPDDFFDPAQPTRLESEVKEVKSEQSEA